MAAIRVLLPPLRSLTADTPLPVAAAEKTAWRRLPPAGLAELGRRWPGARATAFPHPEDLTLTAVSLPPLARARLRVAVEGAIEPLALGDPETLRIGHGARGADGRVGVAWFDAEAADRLQALIAACGLRPAGFAPTPLWLPETVDGWTLCVLDGYVVARQPGGLGSLYALDAQVDDATAGLARVLGPDAAACAAGPCRWIGAAPAGWRREAADVVLPEAACGVMAEIPWSIPAAAAASQAGASGWRRAAWLGAAAAAVWMAGLVLHAGRLEQAAQAAREQLAQRVRDVFPTVGAVVDPVGQARRLLAARQAGAGDDWAELGFLLRAAREHMAFAAGEMQAWRYEAGALELDMPSSARPKAAETGEGAKAGAAPAWIQAARQAGVEVQATDAGWRLRRASQAAGGKPAERS
ncbi:MULTISPECIES: type II secretion system protein GspL [Achromobacter]|uniref:type II secretion system protein GspL n=1 Tax=Achromobacter TaxID=222 RepID=UPI0006BFA5F8|nr:type II secretion system protein GspL [Achromobacter sp. 2789STDY5608615]CUK22747.1 Type II secretory pathway%2C component PulL [Achromobacter sp. 2789STDY5608615]